MRLDETFQVVEVQDKIRQKVGQSFFGSISQKPGPTGTRLRGTSTFAPGTNHGSSRFANVKKDRNSVRSRAASQLNTQHSKKLNDFLKNVLSVLPVDYDVPRLKFNRFPASVNMKSKLVHVHYLFQMLGVGVIFVVDDSNILYGKISREDFINLRYKENDLKKFDLAMTSL